MDERTSVLQQAPFSLLLKATCVLAAGCLAWPAAADEYDALKVVLGGSVSHDSNLFKRPSSAAASDSISTGYVGLRIDKPYAQQRFQFDITETTTRYNKFSSLNFSSLNYKGAWLWHLGPRVSGTLSDSRAESLAPFEDNLNTQRNKRISENRAFNLDGWVYGGWHLLLGVSQSDQKSEQAVQIQPDFSSNSIEAGVRYDTTSGNSITANRRSTDGNYGNLALTLIPGTLNSDYHEDQSELKASWRLSGKSALTGRLAWLERTNSSNSNLNFSGPAGDLGYTWTPTSSLSFIVSASRTTGPLQDPSFNSTVSDRLSFGPTWQVSAKTAVNMSLNRTTLEYSGTGLVPASGPARKDTQDGAQVGVHWSPMRSVTVGADLQRQRRTSNTPGVEFDATIANINASLLF